MKKLGRMFVGCALLVLMGASLTSAQDRRGRDRAGAARARTTAEKREWLRDRYREHFGARRDIDARIDRLTDAEVERLFVAYTRRMAELLAAGGRVNNRLPTNRGVPYYGNRAVGYAPVITWLPQGTSLGVQAYSPDGRNVRISANPFFSSIPSYDTFNFRTGQTRRYYTPASNPGSVNGWPNTNRTPAQQPKLETYYDGLRTRYRWK
ncbi:MAG: hypothetical protein QGG36_14815 [Pirellulaceae bacterium]|jgi:hypothetical protein|nr:hypothetical protein [Pirellulaceae bacterium]MDP7017075.1 hypothetical protein [Pirellulaceae bacterium]